MNVRISDHTSIGRTYDRLSVANQRLSSASLLRQIRMLTRAARRRGPSEYRTLIVLREWRG